MEERAKRYRRVAVSGNSGQTYRKIKVKTAATKLNQTLHETAMAKSAEEISTLSGMVHDIPFFAMMSVNILELLVDKLCKEELKSGEIIINQGELGDKLYLLADGEAEVELDARDGRLLEALAERIEHLRVVLRGS